jgi:hypothetical protein
MEKELIEVREDLICFPKTNSIQILDINSQEELPNYHRHLEIT